MSNNQDNVPSFITEFSEKCIDFVNCKYNIPLDYSMDTLSVLDQYGIDSHDEIKKCTKLKKQQILALLIPTIGSYLGELVRRIFDFRWTALSYDEPQKWRLEFKYAFLYFNPAGIVAEALLNQELEGWNANYEIVDPFKSKFEQSLENLPKVRFEDFFRFTTRIDVLQIIVEKLLVSKEMPPTTEITSFDYEQYILQKKQCQNS